MKNNLWKSSEELVKNSNLNNFEKFISKNYSTYLLIMIIKKYVNGV